MKCQASEAEDQTHSPANAPVAKEAFAPRRLAEKAMREPGGQMLRRARGGWETCLASPYFGQLQRKVQRYRKEEVMAQDVRFSTIEVGSHGRHWPARRHWDETHARTSCSRAFRLIEHDLEISSIRRGPEETVHAE